MKVTFYPHQKIETIPVGSPVQLVRPVKWTVLAELIEKRKVPHFVLGKSTLARLGTKARKLLKERGIPVKVEKSAGRPLETSPEMIKQVQEALQFHESYREIEKKLGVRKSTAHYLVAYALRKKIRKNGKVVQLA